MLKNGMKVGNAEISTPNSITTAAAITAQIITQVSSHQYGGTSV
ncbi:anaerobic ribonucleoside-triphosphate reductase, partial [Enterococcus faecalis]